MTVPLASVTTFVLFRWSGRKYRVVVADAPPLLEVLVAGLSAILAITQSLLAFVV
jgi:hypothetical protein